ncbi:hypothetical protein VH98_12930 [Acinetobacter brisouii]|nr:hypothetical protein VH98_12930 [Acinetobacter brisouii]
MPAPSTKTSFDISYPFILRVTVISIFASFTQSAIPVSLAGSGLVKKHSGLGQMLQNWAYRSNAGDTNQIISTNQLL